MDYAKSFWEMMNRTLGTNIPLDEEGRKAMNEIAERVIHTANPEKDVFHIKAPDIQPGRLGCGAIKKDKWIWFLASLDREGKIEDILFSMIIRNPEQLRFIAKRLNVIADDIESQTEETDEPEET